MESHQHLPFGNYDKKYKPNYMYTLVICIVCYLDTNVKRNKSSNVLSVSVNPTEAVLSRLSDSGLAGFD
jgi:hypothetical protein